MTKHTHTHTITCTDAHTHTCTAAQMHKHAHKYCISFPTRKQGRLKNAWNIEWVSMAVCGGRILQDPAWGAGRHEETERQGSERQVQERNMNNMVRKWLYGEKTENMWGKLWFGIQVWGLRFRNRRGLLLDIDLFMVNIFNFLGYLWPAKSNIWSCATPEFNSLLFYPATMFSWRLTATERVYVRARVRVCVCVSMCACVCVTEREWVREAQRQRRSAC